MDYIWNITGKCNLNCNYCWDIFKNEDELDTFQAKEIIKHISTQSCDMLLFTGGEPLLRNDLIELIHFAKRQGIQHIKICTNGLLLAKRIDEIKYAPISEIHISVDSIVERQDDFRKRSQLVLENIDILINNINLQNTKIVLVSVINYNKLDDFEDVLRYAKEKGVYVTYQLPALVPSSGELNFLLENAPHEKLEQLFSKLQEFHKVYKKQLDFFSNFYFPIAKAYYLEGKIPENCQAGDSFKIISPRGELHVCYSCKNKPYTIQDCFSSKCLIWFRSNNRAHCILQILQSRKLAEGND